MKELWRPVNIEDFYDSHEISNLGAVRSVDREFIRTSGRIQPVKGRLLKLRSTRDGYKRVELNNKGFSRVFNVHRLVLMTFNPIEGMDVLEVNHINSIRDDNRVENLEWVTSKQNSDHAYAHGFGAKGFTHKLSNQIALIRNGVIVSVFGSLSRAEEVLGVPRRDLRAMYASGDKLYGEISLLIGDIDEGSVSKDILDKPIGVRNIDRRSKPVAISLNGEILSVYSGCLRAQNINNTSELSYYAKNNKLYNKKYKIEYISQYEYINYDDSMVDIALVTKI